MEAAGEGGSKNTLLNTRFAKLFDHFGRTADGTALAAAYVTCLGQEGQTYLGAKALLLTLKEQGYRLFAATNGVAAIQSQRLEMAELTGLFEQVFILRTWAMPSQTLVFSQL